MNAIIKRAMIIPVVLISGLIILLWAGERSAKPHLYPPHSMSDQVTIYVTDLGYHAGIILPSKMLKNHPDLEQLRIAISYFEGTEWAEIGWGDKTFYQRGSWDLLSLSTMIRAAFTPTPTVMHIVGFNGHPPSIFAYNDVMELTISKRGLTNMMKAVDASLAIEPDQVAPLGLYGNSRFFPAHGSYHMFHICNHWIAQRLSDAGLPVNITLATWPGLLLRDLAVRAKAKRWPAQSIPVQNQ